MGSYVPSTPGQRQEMLEAIGLHDFRQLYRDVPEEMLLRDGLDQYRTVSGDERVYLLELPEARGDTIGARQHPGAGNEERALRGWKTAEGHGQRREHGARRRDPESAPAGEQASCAVLEVADEQQREGKHRDGNQVHRV